MNIQKHIKKISKFSSIGLLAIGFIVGVAVMYLYFQPIAYQGKTAQEWATLYSSNEKTNKDLGKQLESAKKEIIYDNFLISHPDPNPFMPTPTPIQTNTIELPSYCNEVIQAWEAQGYDRALTNQMMKKNNPECTY